MRCEGGRRRSFAAGCQPRQLELGGRRSRSNTSSTTESMNEAHSAAPRTGVRSARAFRSSPSASHTRTSTATTSSDPEITTHRRPARTAPSRKTRLRNDPFGGKSRDVAVSAHEPAAAARSVELSPSKATAYPFCGLRRNREERARACPAVGGRRAALAVADIVRRLNAGDAVTCTSAGGRHRRRHHRARASGWSSARVRPRSYGRPRSRSRSLRGQRSPPNPIDTAWSASRMAPVGTGSDGPAASVHAGR